MFARNLARLLGLVLLMTTLLAGSEFGFAARKPQPSHSTTDAAGRMHVRPGGRISDAQRRAAARRRKAVHDNLIRSIKKNGGRQ